MTHSRLTRFVTGWISVFEWISWMNDSMTHSRLTRLVTGWISVFEWISWMNDSLTHSRLTRLVTEWISVLNEWLTQDWLDSLLDESVFWTNDSMTHSRLTRFITGWISVLNEWFNDSLKIDSSCFERMIQWLTQDWLVSLLDESVFLNESLERMIQWLTQDWLVSLQDESVFLNDSKTNTYLTAHFLHLKIKYAHTGIDEWNLNVILQQVSDSGIDLWSPTLHITHSQRRRGGTDGCFSLWLSLSYLTGASHVNA